MESFLVTFALYYVQTCFGDQNWGPTWIPFVEAIVCTMFLPNPSNSIFVLQLKKKYPCEEWNKSFHIMTKQILDELEL